MKKNVGSLQRTILTSFDATLLSNSELHSLMLRCHCRSNKLQRIELQDPKIQIFHSKNRGYLKKIKMHATLGSIYLFIYLISNFVIEIFSKNWTWRTCVVGIVMSFVNQIFQHVRTSNTIQHCIGSTIQAQLGCKVNFIWMYFVPIEALQTLHTFNANTLYFGEA